MGFKFKARVVLDIGEHMNGLRAQLLSDEKVRMLDHEKCALIRACTRLAYCASHLQCARRQVVHGSARSARHRMHECEHPK